VQAMLTGEDILFAYSIERIMFAMRHYDQIGNSGMDCFVYSSDPGFDDEVGQAIEYYRKERKTSRTLSSIVVLNSARQATIQRIIDTLRRMFPSWKIESDDNYISVLWRSGQSE
jgi:hypothetical protein